MQFLERVHCPAVKSISSLNDNECGGGECSNGGCGGIDKPITVPVGPVPKFYVRSIIVPGNTGQCLLKTCRINSVIVSLQQYKQGAELLSVKQVPKFATANKKKHDRNA